LNHSLPRERLKYTARPSSAVFGQGLAVHPGEHQHVARARFLRNDGHQALRIPFHFVQPVHGRIVSDLRMLSF
jgi:hypothetical protein